MKTKQDYAVPGVETCGNCGGAVLVMAFRGEGYCSDDCRKALGKKISGEDKQHGTAGL